MRYAVSLTILLYTALLLSPATNAARFTLEGDNTVVGEVRVVPAGENDTLVRLARQYNLGYQAIISANQETDRWLPIAGSPIVLPSQFILPSPKKGLVINLAEMRLYYYPPSQPTEVWTFPIGIGREGWQTPVTQTQIHSKIANPSWTPPASIIAEYAAKGVELDPVFPPGPDNPLGDHAIRLTLPGYLLHGTNRPSGVGMRVSHGCIRLYPEDIAQLFKQTSRNTPVTIIDQPAKLGWHKDRLYLEIHPPAYPANRLKRSANGQLMLLETIRKLEKSTEIDWQAVARIIHNANGVPGHIGQRKSDISAIVTPSE